MSISTATGRSHFVMITGSCVCPRSVTAPPLTANIHHRSAGKVRPQRFQMYGVVVDTFSRPDRSKIGREYSVESLCTRVFPRARADRAQAAMGAR